ETKQYASTLPDYTPEQDVEIDDFINTQAVDVPANVKTAALTAGLVKGSASVMGGIGGGLGGLAVGGPVGAIVGGVGGAIAGGELAEAGLQKFTPKVARSREFAPGFAAAGQYAPEVVMGTVGARQLVQAGKTLFQELGAKRAAQELGKVVGTSAGVSAAVGSGVRAITGSEVTPGTVAEDALFGALYAGIGSGSRVKGYNFNEFKDLNYKVKAGRATPAETRDWQQILNEAQRTQTTGVERAKRTEVQLGGKTVLDKVNLEGGAPTEVRPYYEPLPAPTSTEIQVARPQSQERPIKPATVIPQEQLPEAGVRGNVRGTQADTAAMQRRGIITPMQESLVDLNDPVPKTNVFTTESQGINRKAIIPDTRGLQGEIVREGPIVTPRTQLPSSERLALPAEGEFRPTRKAEEAAAVIELEKGMEERIRQSPQGQRALRKDLEAVAVKEEKPIVETSYSDPGQQYLEWQKNINKSGVKYLAASDYDENKNWEKEGGIKIDNSYYSTIVSGDTRIAVSSSGLYLRRGKVSQSYEADIDKNGNQIYTVERIVTDPTKRGTGSASNALKKLTDIADKSNVTLQLEPATVESLSGKGQKSLTFQQLGDWYKRNGFVPKFEESNSVLIREPKQAVSKPTIPRPMRGKAGEAGFIVSDVQEGAAKVAQKWLTTEGNLPKEMFDIMEAKGSRTQAMLKQIDFTLKDLAKAARELNGKPKLTPQQSLQVDQFLRGYLPAENLPEAIRPVAQQMRRQLDNLSEGLIQSGVFSQEVGPSGMSKADIIRMNKGEYLTRSYEKFDNPKFNVELLKKRDLAKYTQAETFVRNELKAQNPSITEEEVQGRIREIVEQGRDKPMESMIQASGIGKKLGITKARQNIPEQIRYLMGEYNDPIINYARSASKMINLLQSQQQLNKLKEFGIANKLFFEKPTGTAVKQIAADGSDTRSPLNGLYAEPELVDAIENFEMMHKGGTLF
ncbi:MAG: hypothetical protein EBR82_56420, partial [Caulobacteraceae bacterium]|nr:hypothetical protein [Caulobacteraceae bacterium]